MGSQAQQRTHEKGRRYKGIAGLIARQRQKRLLDLMGKAEWDSSYDYKAERRRD
jgi:hypothetical protein